jgi:hypothetical protein
MDCLILEFAAKPFFSTDDAHFDLFFLRCDGTG